MTEVKDSSLYSLVDKQKYKNRLKTLNKNDNFIKLYKTENIYNHKNDNVNNANDINNINNDNNILNMNNSNLNIHNSKKFKRFKSVSLHVNYTHNIEDKINQMLKNINNIYKLFFACIFCRSEKIRTSYNIYKINRSVLENKMDVVNYLRLIEKGNNLKIAN